MTLGELGSSQWSPMSAAIPTYLEPPLQLLSVQLFEPGFGPVGTPGSVLFDDIHVTVGANGEEQIIDDFEGNIKWTALATSKLSSDSIASDRGDSQSGDASGLSLLRQRHPGRDSRVLL